MPTLRKIILEVGNHEFSFSQISGILEKCGNFNKIIIIL